MTLHIARKYYVEHILISCSHNRDVKLASAVDFSKRLEARLNERQNLPRWGATRRQVILGAAAVLGGITAYPGNAWSDDGLGLSRGAETIHQEPTFQASRKRVYEALTDSQQFDKVMRLSAAMRSMATGAKPAEISRDEGGAFSLFGGYVSGRHIELVPNQRIVQAWRPQSWEPGVYSIVKFELVEQGTGTKILFDHRGFPDGTGEHLAIGWRQNYWGPLQQYLEMHT